MSTFITVLPVGSSDDAYRAVQACQFIESVQAWNFYDSRNSQDFEKRNTDTDLGPKVVKNTRTGSRITCRLVKLQDTRSINVSIMAPGCNHIAQFGFTTEISNLIEDFNTIASEKIKISKQKGKLKEGKKQA